MSLQCVVAQQKPAHQIPGWTSPGEASTFFSVHGPSMVKRASLLVDFLFFSFCCRIPLPGWKVVVFVNPKNQCVVCNLNRRTPILWLCECTECERVQVSFVYIVCARSWCGPGSWGMPPNLSGKMESTIYSECTISILGWRGVAGIHRERARVCVCVRSLFECPCVISIKLVQMCWSRRCLQNGFLFSGHKKISLVLWQSPNKRKNSRFCCAFKYDQSCVCVCLWSCWSSHCGVRCWIMQLVCVSVKIFVCTACP